VANQPAFASTSTTDRIMVSLPDGLNPAHQRSLTWFDAHARLVVPYSDLRKTDPMLVHQALGIWRPSGWDYALSIRQTLNSPYFDSSIVTLPTGDWIYRYHRETGSPVSQHRNDGLVTCMRDGVPVGVLIQHTPKPNTTYWVVGLGRITWFDGEFFTVEQWEATHPYTYEAEELDERRYQLSLADDVFDPNHYDHQRDVRLQALAIRHGQGVFRQLLLDAYGRRCAVTGSHTVPALDAAHIHPYGGKATNVVTNGMLLRTDIHKLFDLRLLAVDTTSMTQIVSPVLEGTEYEQYHGTPLILPKHPSLQPSIKALDQHRELASL
jgi:hypothetical protein